MGIRRLLTSDGADRADGRFHRRPGIGHAAAVTYQGQNIDLKPPWQRIELRDGMLEVTGIDIEQHSNRRKPGGRNARQGDSKPTPRPRAAS